jgi:plasmid stabilization system protein ParE
MSPEFVFLLHPGAAQDITDIWEFIADDNPLAARRVQRVRDYLIAYAPDEKPIVVLAVLHGRRSPRVMAAILRERQGV